MMKRKQTKWIIGTAILLLLLQFIFFYQFWLTLAGKFLVYQDRLQQADAILVLGGGRRERVEQGVALYKEGYAGRLLFTGEYDHPVSEDSHHWAVQAQKLAVQLGVPKDRTILIFNSRSTRDDAALSRAVCVKNRFSSLIVVSEPYHTKRSFYTFRNVYGGSGIKIMVYPVQKSWYRPDNWWRSEEGVLATNSEYVKLIFYLFKGYL